MSETTISYSVREIGEVLTDLAEFTRPVGDSWDAESLRALIGIHAKLARLAMKRLDPDGNVALALKVREQE